jgi:hypothetical protein
VVRSKVRFLADAVDSLRGAGSDSASRWSPAGRSVSFFAAGLLRTGLIVGPAGRARVSGWLAEDGLKHVEHEALAGLGQPPELLEVTLDLGGAGRAC